VVWFAPSDGANDLAMGGGGSCPERSVQRRGHAPRGGGAGQWEVGRDGRWITELAREQLGGRGLERMIAAGAAVRVVGHQ